MLKRIGYRIRLFTGLDNQRNVVYFQVKKKDVLTQIEDILIYIEWHLVEVRLRCARADNY